MPVVGPSARVKLSIEAQGLASKDWTSKSDPMAVLYAVDAGTGAETMLGHTEWIKDNSNPKFQTLIECEYHFEKKQKFVIRIIDVDDPKNPLNNFQEIGKVECTMGKLVGSPKGRFESPLIGKGGKDGFGKLIVIAEELKGRNDDLLHLSMKGVELANKDGMFGKSDPYLKFFALRKDGAVVEVHKTETIPNNLNPVWKPFAVDMDRLCNGDLDAKFKLECWDEDSMSSDDMIGWIETTVNQLLSRQPLVLNDRPGGKTAKPGSLAIDSIHITRIPSFLDYITEGCELTVTMAVDFTASNGDPADPKSLHAMVQGQLNQYQKAMMSIGEIIIDYDKDKKVGALGFGAILPGGAEASHCFALTGAPTQTEVEGVEGLLKAYADSRQVVKLYGPTNFEPVIRHVAMMAKECRKRAYHVLLILTDGDITDKQKTITALVEASSEPVSVIIVGVGDEDFEEMELLDGDTEGLVSEDGVRAQRDIVQFVAFKDCRSQEELSAQVLAELPGQLLGYMGTHNTAPAAWKGTPYQLPNGHWYGEHKPAVVKKRR
eukprot:GHVU01214836.1.p1 GENE.GHVU01214836.1~~GHVU01214836.1.p1  ORF type:complete len:563 (+),score=135.63 GHVU01214836.1:54-1691(+)